MTLVKHGTILAFLEELAADLGPEAFTVVDHWEADLCSIGVASPANHDLYAYVSTWDQAPGHYYVDLDERTGAAFPVTKERMESVDYSTALAKIRQHLRT